MDTEKSCETCINCLYVGEGGFWCCEKEKMVADDWDFSRVVVLAEDCKGYEEK